jgi:hypothetical protein
MAVLFMYWGGNVVENVGRRNWFEMVGHNGGDAGGWPAIKVSLATKL